MKNTRSISAFFLVVFANWLVGCMSYDEEIISDQLQICNNNNKVLQASFTNSEQVIFDSDGGEMLLYPLAVRGNIATGELRIKPIGDVKQIYSGYPPQVQPFDALLKDRSIKITQIDLRGEGMTIMFDSSGGKLVDSALVLRGLSEGSVLYEVEPQSIDHLVIEEVNLISTILSTIAVTALTGVIVLIIAIALAPAPTFRSPPIWKL